MYKQVIHVGPSWRVAHQQGHFIKDPRVVSSTAFSGAPSYIQVRAIPRLERGLGGLTRKASQSRPIGARLQI